MTESAAPVRVVEETSAYWRVLFENPPFNIADATIFQGLQDLLARMGAAIPILMDTFVRLTKCPVVSIAKIRGCVRGVSSRSYPEGYPHGTSAALVRSDIG